MLDHPTVWHEGERALHIKRGVEERLHALGLKVIRDYMPDQHREFFEMLSEVHISTVDNSGHPVAITRVGSPGFMSSPDAHTLAHPLDASAWRSGGHRVCSWFEDQRGWHPV